MAFQASSDMPSIAIFCIDSFNKKAPACLIKIVLAKRATRLFEKHGSIEEDACVNS